LTVKTIQDTVITVVSLRSKFSCRHLLSRADNSYSYLYWTSLCRCSARF